MPANIILHVCGQACPNYPKLQVCNIFAISQVKLLLISFYVCVAKHDQITQNNKLTMFLHYLKKKVRDEVNFCMQTKIKGSYKLILTLWASKFPTRWYYYWWARSSILIILKVTSFQYLYNISKKKLIMEFIFCMQINIKVSTSWHYCFWWKWSDISKVPKIGRKLVIFLKCLKNKLSQLLLCFTVMQNILIFYRSLVMFAVTCFESIWLV